MESQNNTPTLQGYIAGYALSILLTLLIFGITYIHVSHDHETISHPLMYTLIVITALSQLVVQSIFFLHLSLKKGQRSNLITFTFMLLIVFLIAGGSLWIINNLNNNMSPEQINKYMQNED
jgi:cytochrome o ubiquinol oxidase operon protein cyoD